jgi:glyoxylase-like metal-dependent hydrolase (beta-lactamase superfamily II)
MATTVELRMKTFDKLAAAIAATCALLSLAVPVKAQNEAFQHQPLPAQLPAGVTLAQAQHLQAQIDEFRFVEPLVVSKLKDNIYFARGGPDNNAPNMSFVVGPTGVILIDNKNSIGLENAVLAEIARITPKPVIADIVLHSEHESGLAALPAGVTIIAHENAKRRMEVSTERDKVPSTHFPTKTVGNDETMTIDGIRVRLLHFAPAVSDNDLIAYFPDQKVAFASTVLVMNFPIASTVIHRDLGGSVRGWIENAKGLLALDADTYVTDHGGVLTKDDLRTKLAFVQQKWNKVKAMVAEGKSLDEIRAAVPSVGDRKPTTVEDMYADLQSK